MWLDRVPPDYSSPTKKKTRSRGLSQNWWLNFCLMHPRPRSDWIIIIYGKLTFKSRVSSWACLIFHAAVSDDWIDWRRCSKTTGHFPFGSLHLDIFEHSDHALMWNKTTEQRSPRRGGLGSITSEPWSGSFVVRTQPTQKENSLDMRCLATGAKRSHVNVDNTVLYLLCIAIFARHFDHHPLFFYSFAHSFINFTVSLSSI